MNAYISQYACMYAFPVHSTGVGTRLPLRSLPSQAILWFYAYGFLSLHGIVFQCMALRGIFKCLEWSLW